MNAKELKPCPFCGCPAELHEATGTYFISCTKCDCTMSWNSEQVERSQDVVDKWNKRAALEAEKLSEDAREFASKIEHGAHDYAEFWCHVLPQWLQSYAESYHKKECAKCKKEKTCDNCGNCGVACLECSHIQPDNWIPAEDPNTFRRFEKRSGITTDVTDGVEQ